MRDMSEPIGLLIIQGVEVEIHMRGVLLSGDPDIVSDTFVKGLIIVGSIKIEMHTRGVLLSNDMGITEVHGSLLALRGVLIEYYPQIPALQEALTKYYPRMLAQHVIPYQINRIKTYLASRAVDTSIEVNCSELLIAFALGIDDILANGVDVPDEWHEYHKMANAVYAGAQWSDFSELETGEAGS